MKGLRGGKAQTPRRRGRGASALGATAALVVGVGLAGLAAPAGAGQGPSQYHGLKKDLLVHSDFPSGWSAQGSVTTSDGGGGSFPGRTALASCVGVSQSLLNIKSPTATSPNFQDKAGEHYVQDNANAFSSTKQANEEYAAVSRTEVPGCLTTELQSPATKEQLQTAMRGATVGTVVVTAANPSGLVPHSSGFTISFPTTLQGFSTIVEVTVVSLVRGKTGTQLSFTAVGTPFSTSLEHHLVAVAYKRT